VTLVCLMAFSAGLLLIAPYHFYSLALEEGISTDFLKISSFKKTFYKGGVFRQNRIDGASNSEDESLWQVLPFYNYILPLPQHHPVFLVIPRIEHYQVDKKEKLYLGFVFKDQRENELARFMSGDDLTFKMSLNKDKIFQLPVFKNKILRTSLEQVWKDMFLKDLHLPEIDGQNYFSSLKKVWDLSYSDLVYNLFILQMRLRYLPKGTTKISYIEKKKMGVVEVSDDDALDDEMEHKFTSEIFFMYDKGIIHKFKLRVQNDDSVIEAFRARIVKELKYEATTPDKAKFLHSLHQKLEYRKKIDQEGMVYMFSGWTHEMENEGFFRETIHFMHRGEDNQINLSPLMDYALSRWGTNFSPDPRTLVETPERKLKRLREEALNTEIKDESKREVSNTEGEFTSKKSKIDYLLKKAKEEGEDPNENDGVLIVE
jgi:hypothetical protein